MTAARRRLLDDALKLGPKARLDLAARLIASVEPPGQRLTGAAWTSAVSRELDARWEEADRIGDWGRSFRSGKARRER